jgi:tripartite-type tricarboxylate transporter receptor subunit TctC
VIPTILQLTAALTLGTFLGATGIAQAQTYPDRPIRLILGPSPEATPRLIAERLHKELGQPVVVEPRLGAGGEIAAKAVSSADPDGYTLLYASSNFTLATAMQLGSFDFGKDFEPIARVGTSAYVLVVHPDLPAKTPTELIALAKAKPGQLNCGSSGMATPGHLSCEMLKSMAGMDVVHVPFRNAGAAMNGLVSNQVQLAVTVSTAARGQIEAGTIRGLAVTTAEPSGLVPGLPTLQTTIPGFVVHGWGSFVAPKGTPKPVIEKLNATIIKILQDPEINAKLLTGGMQPSPPHTPEEFGAFIHAEIARWNRTIDIANIRRGKPM